MPCVLQHRAIFYCVAPCGLFTAALRWRSLPARLPPGATDAIRGGIASTETGRRPSSCPHLPFPHPPPRAPTTCSANCHQGLPVRLGRRTRPDITPAAADIALGRAVLRTPSWTLSLCSVPSLCMQVPIPHSAASYRQMAWKAPRTALCLLPP